MAPWQHVGLKGLIWFVPVMSARHDECFRKVCVEDESCVEKGSGSVAGKQAWFYTVVAVEDLHSDRKVELYHAELGIVALALGLRL